MFHASVIFFGLSIAALLLGVYGFGGITFEIGRILLFSFLALSIAAFFWDFWSHLRSRHPPPLKKNSHGSKAYVTRVR